MTEANPTAPERSRLGSALEPFEVTGGETWVTRRRVVRPKMDNHLAGVWVMGLCTDTDGALRFGSFELDIRSRELRTGDTRIRLQEQPFEILRMMLERPGDVVTRDELQRRLWPDGTFVDFEHSLNAAVKRLRAALGDDADNPRFVETLPRRGYRFIGALADNVEAAGSSLPRTRLAVLPFTSLSDDAAHEYFTEGLTEEMIAQLGQLCRGSIGVIARWSSMMFKGSTLRAREIGQALRADYLLEGSVRRESDRVRITARLIAAADETHLWAETYERHLTDCLSVQADVAARIARSLAVELVPADGPVSHGGPTSASAYQEYLKGRYHWNRPDHELTGMDALDRALSSFEQALRIDRDFAPAHAMVARVYIARAEYYAEQPRRALETARSSAKRALDLDPQLAEAHLALGDVRRLLEWDWRGAELAYAQAMVLNPSQENAHRRYGSMLVSLSRYPDAVREAQRACELDPLCLVVSTSAAFVSYLAGHYEEAIERCRRTIDLDPQYLPAQRLIGAAYLQAGRTQDALDVLEAAHAAAPHSPIVIAWLAHARATAGDRTGAADRLARWHRLDRTWYLPPYHLALAHVGLGDADAAFAALEQAVADSDPALVYLAVEPRFEPIRPDPRFARLLDLLGLT